MKNVATPLLTPNESALQVVGHLYYYKIRLDLISLGWLG
jgi:hypothetical protein